MPADAETVNRARTGYLLVTLAGILGALCWLPTGVSIVFPVYAFLFFRGLRCARTGGEAFRIGLFFGVSRYLVAAHFLLALMRYSPLAVIFYLLSVVFILPFALAETYGAFWMERWTGLSRIVWASLIYSLMEWLRTLGDLSFPADLATHGLGTIPAWLSWMGWTGPFGMTFVIFGAGMLLDRAWEARHERRRAAFPLAAALLLWVAPPLTFVLAAGGGGPGSPLRVGIVQPCVTIDDKLDPARSPEVWKRLDQLTREAAGGADLVVWPESARPDWVVWHEPSPFRDEPMEALSRRVGVPILYGFNLARVSGERVQIYNGAAIVFPDDRSPDWYGKQRLLPFVEAFPFAGAFGWDPGTRQPGTRAGSYLTMLGNYSPGPRPTVFQVGGARIGVLICYEGQYPQLARRYRREGANLLAVITNDAWWGRSVFPSWHARMIGARVRETGMPAIRAANNGVSSYTDLDGRMRARTPLGEVTTLQIDVEPAAPGLTPYVRGGELLVAAGWVCLAAGLAFGGLRRLRRRGAAEPATRARGAASG
jgi:apolipoprotein N-acyltransferase